ncbi:unnamed protein product, partial [Gulo gulo]
WGEALSIHYTNGRLPFVAFLNRACIYIILTTLRVLPFKNCLGVHVAASDKNGRRSWGPSLASPVSLSSVC